MRRNFFFQASLLCLMATTGCCGRSGGSPVLGTGYYPGSAYPAGRATPVSLTQHGTVSAVPMGLVSSETQPPVPMSISSISPQVYSSVPPSAQSVTTDATHHYGRYARHLNVALRPGSRTDRIRRQVAALPGRTADNRALAPGLAPSPSEDLRYRGGKTIPHLTFVNIYVGGDNSWDPNDIKSIDHALAAAMSDKNLNNVMRQYFDNKPITGTAKPSHILQGPRPQTVTKSYVRGVIQYLYNQKNLSEYDLTSTVFNLMLPRGTILTDEETGNSSSGESTGREREEESEEKNPIPHEEEASSLAGLGGFHGSIHAGHDTIYYAVGVYSERRADGTANGIPVFDKSWKNVVATFYHELMEARTDPDVEDAIRAGNDPSADSYLGWTSDRGEECGDYPVDEATQLGLVFQEVPLADGSGTVPVQLQYSNAVHGPEGPISTPHGMVPTPANEPDAPPANGGQPAGGDKPPGNGGKPKGDSGLSHVIEGWPQLPVKAKRSIVDIVDIFKSGE